jgi:hypothetical protein
METHVSRRQEPKWNIEELTDAEIYSAIRYLDGELAQDRDSHLGQAGAALFRVCVLLIIVLVGYLGYFWLYRSE